MTQYTESPHLFRYPSLTDTPNVPRDIQALAEDIGAYVDVHPGPQGTQGLQGPQGLQGTQGLQSPQGLQGAQGSQGLQGQQGLQGNQGNQGVQGTQGIQSPQGLQGIQGIQGIIGPAGPSIAINGVEAATTGALPNSPVYAAGTTLGADGGYGKGATLTATTYGALTIDGYTPVVADAGDRILVKDQVDPKQNGVYTLSQGDSTHYWKLTRATDFDGFASATQIQAGVFLAVYGGTAGSNLDTTWIMVAQEGSGTHDENIVVGVDPINWAKSNGVAIQGTQGLQGIQGLQGQQGSQGLQGPQGLQGIQGIAASYVISSSAPNSPIIGEGWVNSNTGKTYIWDGTEWFESYNNQSGLQGLQGLQGFQGLQGSQGFQGLQGLNGAYAGQGIQGLQGAQGTQGNTGVSYSTPTLGTTDIPSGQKISTIAGLTLTAPVITYSINSENSGSTVSYTTVLSDAASVITTNNSSANNVLIPTNASVPYPVGTSLTVVQLGTGQTTFTAVTPGTTTITSVSTTPAAPLLRTQYSGATAVKIATDTWWISGDIA